MNNNEYSYQIYEPEIFFTAQRSRMKVYYDQRNLSEVHLFDCENRFLGIIQSQLVYDGPDANTTLDKHREGKRKINKYANEQRKKWKEEMVEHKVTDLKSKVLHTEFHDDLVDDPDQELQLFLTLNGISLDKPTTMI